MRCIRDGWGKKTCQCIIGRKGGKIDGRWKWENIVEVIECPKTIRLLGNTHIQDSKLVSPTQLPPSLILVFCRWEVECYEKKVSL